MSNHLDRLTGQLYHLPSTIGRLGLSIAEAQRELNADYLRNVKELMAMLSHAWNGEGPNDPAKPETSQVKQERMAALAPLLQALAPTRYQFTETTLEFSADLAESMSVASSVGASVGIAAVSVSASVSIGYARDYRASARISTVMHAYPSTEVAAGLLERAAKISESKFALPESVPEVDKEIWTSTSEILNGLTGSKLASERPEPKSKPKP